MEDQTEITQEQEEEIPRFRTPFSTYVYAALGIIGILGFAAGMLYAWSQVL